MGTKMGVHFRLIEEVIYLLPRRHPSDYFFPSRSCFQKPVDTTLEEKKIYLVPCHHHMDI
ncbi:hypothetical protein ACSBR1_002738 [Camellia fascicularis]